MIRIRLTHWGQIVATIALVLFLIAGVSPSQATDTSEPSARSAQDTPEPVASQTIDGVTVAIVNAGSDGSSLQIHYELIVHEDSPYDDPFDLHTGTMTITDAQGNHWSPMGGGGGGGGGEEIVYPVIVESGGGTFVPDSPITQDSIDLTVEMAVGLWSTYNNETGTFDTEIGTFVLEFTIAVTPDGIEMPEGAIAVDNASWLEISFFETRPGSTDVSICYTRQATGGSYSPYFALDTGDGLIFAASVSGGGGGGSGGGPDGVAFSTNCTGYSFDTSSSTPGTWKIVVLELQRDNTYTNAELFAALDENGISLSYNESDQNFTPYSTDMDVDVYAALDAVMAGFNQPIEGPWEFTVEVPAD